MCAGDFLQAYKDSRDQFDVVATVFFLDTAANPLQYIRLIHKILRWDFFICHALQNFLEKDLNRLRS